MRERDSGRKLGDGLEGGVRGSREVPGGDGETDGQTDGLGAVSGLSRALMVACRYQTLLHVTDWSPHKT